MARIVRNMAWSMKDSRLSCRTTPLDASLFLRILRRGRIWVSDIGDDSIGHGVDVLVDVEVSAVEERRSEQAVGVTGPPVQRLRVDATIMPAADGVDIGVNTHTWAAVVAVERLIVAPRRVGDQLGELLIGQQPRVGPA